MLPNDQSHDCIWPRTQESGWFKGPRALPLILNMVNTKALRGKLDIASTYLALLAENHEEGRSKFAASPIAPNSRASAVTPGVSMWRERMRKLVEIGLIKIFKRGTQEVGFVAIAHPYDVPDTLHSEKRLPDDGMWNLFQLKVREHGGAARKSNVLRMARNP